MKTLPRPSILEPGSTEPRRVDFKVAFERPNKLRLKFYQGEVVCDGKKWFAFSKDIPGQAVLRDAPREDQAADAASGPVLEPGAEQRLRRRIAASVLLLEEKPL